MSKWAEAEIWEEVNPEKEGLWVHESQRARSCFPLNKTNSNSKESREASEVRAGPRVRQVRHEIEGAPDNSGIEIQDLNAIVEKKNQNQCRNFP